MVNVVSYSNTTNIPSWFAVLIVFLRSSIEEDIVLKLKNDIPSDNQMQTDEFYSRLCQVFLIAMDKTLELNKKMKTKIISLITERKDSDKNALKSN